MHGQPLLLTLPVTGKSAEHALEWIIWARTDARRTPGRAYGRTLLVITVTFSFNNVRRQLFNDFQPSALDQGLREFFRAVTEGVQIEGLQLKVYFDAELET